MPPRSELRSPVVRSRSMARQMRWHRSPIEYASGGAYSNGFRVQGAYIDVGETLTRIRWQFLLSHVDTTAAHSLGMGVAVGAIVGPESWTAADVPGPWDFPDEDWVWWEGGFFTGELDGDSTGVVGSTGLYPREPRERDVRAQRGPAPVGGLRLWFATQTSTLSPLQSRHYLSLSYSAGILEAP